MIRVKKAFTLIELIIVVILISIVYSLMISSSSFKISDNSNRFSLVDVKTFLLDNYSFYDEISLVCIEKNYDCYVRVDGKINSDQVIEKVFRNTPDVYEYQQEQKKIDFLPVRIDNNDYNVVFEFKINSDFKSKDYILDTLENRVYIFNSIFKKAKIFKSLSEAFEIFEKNKLEVKDAF